jgi:hypothetical protein
MAASLGKDDSSLRNDYFSFGIDGVSLGYNGVF